MTTALIGVAVLTGPTLISPRAQAADNTVATAPIGPTVAEFGTLLTLTAPWWHGAVL